jgi:hypothetical protein
MLLCHRRIGVLVRSGEVNSLKSLRSWTNIHPPNILKSSDQFSPEFHLLASTWSRIREYPGIQSDSVYHSHLK